MQQSSHVVVLGAGYGVAHVWAIGNPDKLRAV